MPVQSVKLPDGTVRQFAFPDNATPEQIEEFLNSPEAGVHVNREQFGPPSPMAFGNKQGTIARAAQRSKTLGVPSRPQPGLPGGRENLTPTLSERLRALPIESHAGVSDALTAGVGGVGDMAINSLVVPVRSQARFVGTLAGGGSLDDAVRAGVSGAQPIAPVTNFMRDVTTRTANVERTVSGIRPQTDLSTQDAIVRGAAGLAAVPATMGVPTRAATPSALPALDDLPETQRLADHFAAHVKGNRTADAPARALRAAKEVARSGISPFDPNRPQQFVSDIEDAVQRIPFARAQLVSTDAGGAPNISTDVAIRQIENAAASTDLSTNEAATVKQMGDILRAKGQTVSARDLHNVVEQFGSNVPGTVRAAITPIIDANVPGYAELGHQQAGLIDAKTAAARIIQQQAVARSRGSGAGSLVGTAVRGAAKGAVTGTIVHGPGPGTLAGAGEGALAGMGTELATSRAAATGGRVVSSGELAASTRALRRVAGQIGVENPTAKALASVLPPSTPEQPPQVESAVGRFAGRENAPPLPLTDKRVAGATPQTSLPPTGPTFRGEEFGPTIPSGVRVGPRALVPAGSSPDYIPPDTFVNPQTNPRRALPPMTGPNVQPSSGATFEAESTLDPRFYNVPTNQRVVAGPRPAGVELSSTSGTAEPRPFREPSRTINPNAGVPQRTTMQHSPDPTLAETAAAGPVEQRLQVPPRTTFQTNPGESPSVNFNGVTGIGGPTPSGSGAVRARVGNVDVQLPADHPALQSQAASPAPPPAEPEPAPVVPKRSRGRSSGGSGTPKTTPVESQPAAARGAVPAAPTAPTAPSAPRSSSPSLPPPSLPPSAASFAPTNRVQFTSGQGTVVNGVVEEIDHMNQTANVRGPDGRLWGPVPFSRLTMLR